MIEQKVYQYNGNRVRLRLDEDGYVRISVLEGRFGWQREVSLYGYELPALRDAIDEFIKLNPK